MAINLPTNYKDDVLDTSKNERRKFNIINNEDGTVSFEDVTEYTVEGSTFGAMDINNTNGKVNKLSRLMDSITGATKIDNVRANMNTKEYTYVNESITENSLALIFWDKSVANDVANINVIAETINGGIKFTSDESLNKSLPCSVYIFGEAEESEE